MKTPKETAVRISAKLYEAREAMRRLHGDNWGAIVARERPLIEAVMKRFKTTNELDAIAQLSRQEPIPAAAAVLLLGVAVEMIEPTTPVSNPQPNTTT